jgi:hypothetical protein
MSEQPTSQPSGQSCEQPIRRSRAANFGDKGFKPGQSGNPRGSLLIPDRIRAEALDLISDFERVHQRPPTRSERSRIETAADFRVQSKRERKHSAEDRNKMARTSELILRKLGIDRPARSANGSMPWPSAKAGAK